MTMMLLPPQWSPISTISADEFLQHVAEEIELPNIMEDPEIEVELTCW